MKTFKELDCGDACTILNMLKTRLVHFKWIKCVACELYLKLFKNQLKMNHRPKCKKFKYKEFQKKMWEKSLSPLG